MPDPTIPSGETGTRHRTAERVAKQTGALVISISQQRATISVYVGPSRYQLETVPDVLAKTNQALATLETYGAAPRPGADAADRARVPERGRARRRPRCPAARGDDEAYGRRDRARLRRARCGSAPDQDAAERARRRGAGGPSGGRPRLPRRRRRARVPSSRWRACTPCRTGSCSNRSGWSSCSAIRAT